MKDVVVNKDNFNNEAMSKYIKNKFSKVIISQEIKILIIWFLKIKEEYRWKHEFS